jgi:hypothetical protein
MRAGRVIEKAWVAIKESHRAISLLASSTILTSAAQAV